MVTAPYGSWVSPISVADLTSAAVGLGAVRVDGDDLYWLESRADQGGRVGLWRRPLAGGDPVEVTPADANVRTRVHEYGGGEYGVDAGVVVWSNFADNRLYRRAPGGEVVALTASAELRYADLRVHAGRGIVLAVREDHRGAGECVNTLVAVPLDGSAAADASELVLRSGSDFYSTPELSAEGRLAWVQWEHPNMPWDSTTLRVGTLGPDGLSDVVTVAGGISAGESVLAPRWLGSDLLFVSDRTDWWNLYRWSGGEVAALRPDAAEYCEPQWVLGQTPYAVLDDDTLVCTTWRSGVPEVALLTVSTGRLELIADASVGATSLDTGGTLAAILSHPDRPATLAVRGPDGWDEVRATSPRRPEPERVSVARAVTWSSDEGDVHGWYYPPTNPDFTAPEGERPPLITLSHGGPTAQATPSYAVGYQFWTSRGYAILDVNYGGSTGYGRAYRERLKGRWGLVDVADCANGATALGEQGLADPARLAVKGGSAGGYTTLRALTATRAFGAGISQYGVGDLESLARDTHKFEARYLDGLVGPYPRDRAVYLDRSPINHVDELAAPVLLLQGLDDKVVPPNQAELMAEAARAKGLPVALIMFAGEGHGFRRAETIKASTEAQLYFLGRVFGFTPADDVPPIQIDNLD